MDRVGRFRVTGELGRGGMGIVYRAEDPRLKRAVALKLLPEAARGSANERRMIREARLAAAINHPNVATIYEIGEAGGVLYIAMELVEGDTLRARLKQGPLGAAEALRLGVQLARGLARAHEKGIVHRDLKPENVIVTREGDAKILDFGIAKLHGGPSGGELATDSLETQGPAMGTPSYVSPEQASGKAFDHRTDLFSFGVVLYEMLMGSRPFRGKTRFDVLVAVARDEPRPLRDKLPEVPAELQAVLDRCLAKKPEDRYANAQDLLAALEPIATGPLVPGVPAAAGSAPAGPEKTPSLAPGASNATILDHPLPASESREAIVKYREALEALRDGAWKPAEDRLREAIELDPRLAPALLRYALILDGTHSRLFVEKRALFKRAVAARQSLTPRDRALLHAVEPELLAEPPDRAACARRLAVLCEKLPFDAELHQLAGLYHHGIDARAALGFVRRALEIDPEYADAYETLGIVLTDLEAFDEAREAIEHAVELSPGAQDAHALLALLAAQQGDATTAERCARSSMALDFTPVDYDVLTGALYARGRGTDAIAEVLGRKWALLPEARRPLAQASDETMLAILAGDFDAAIERAAEWERLLEPSAESALHGHLAATRVLLALERGDDDYGAIAVRYLDRSEALPHPGRPWHDAAPMCLAAARRAKLLDAETFQRRLREATELRGRAAPGAGKGLEWTITYAPALSLVGDAAIAEEARLAKPPSDAFWFGLVPMMRADAGSALVELGLLDEAIVMLRRAAGTCLATSDPFRSTHAYHALGVALALRGDVAAARNALGVVVARWGGARPRSTTAQDAASRLAAIPGS